MWQVGLSPATRGTLAGWLDLRSARRFIPGYAGNAYVLGSAADSITVYPRLRGERCTKINRYAKYIGLSPATRGTPSAQDIPS